ncbi:MAG: hypothetical protein R3B57_00450 [Phycisphaerales bacterium]
MPRASRLLLLLAIPLAWGCAARTPPIDPARAEDPEIRGIARAFEATVQRLREDPDTHWHTGWTGNIAVHMLGANNKGLCHQWRDEVYTGVAPTTRDLGWIATTIVINWGDAGEHNAVVVYDPARWHRAPPLDEAPELGAYVLDAWRRGRADIYTLRGWLSNQRHVTRAAELVDPEQPRAVLSP